MVDAVLVDEEAVESMAKVLHGEGALELFLHETKSSGDPLVCFPYSLPM